MTIGTLMARYALADIRRRRQSGLDYARMRCVCGHRRDEHEGFEGACIMPHATRCETFTTEGD